jgi:membrane-bound metal-dependent hydrolase YbcI (DUF457 family)
MLRRTHEAWAPVPWLAGTLAVDTLGLALHSGLVVSPLVAILSVPLTRPFSAGLNSPDMDQRWAPGRPRNNYDWRGHRGFTHRLWFAWVLTLGLGVLPTALLWGAGAPLWVLPAVFAPVAGWWSHLSGDMIRGRLPVHWPRRRWVKTAAGWQRRWVMWQTNVGLGDRLEKAEPKLVFWFWLLTCALAVGHVFLLVWSLTT